MYEIYFLQAMSYMSLFTSFINIIAIITYANFISATLGIVNSSCRRDID